MKYEDLLNAIIDKNIYLIQGDSFLSNKAKQTIFNKLNVDSMSISFFNDENFVALDVLNSCNQFSFFDDKRVVVVENIGKALNEKDKNLFLSYEKNVNVNCVLIILDNLKVFDFLKSAEVITCTPSDNYVSDFIKNEFKKYEKKIEVNASNKLKINCLGNLTRIEIEVKKICDYLKDQNIVTEEVVNLLVSKDTELKVFDLTTALSAKNIKKAQQVLYDMLKASEPPIKILALISNHFRRMFFAKINKGSNLELSKILGCKEYAITKAKEQGVNFTAKQLKEIESLLLEVDYSIKSGDMSQENALYYLIFKIVNI